jgi:hypothetical protein
MATSAQLRELRRKHHLGEFRRGYVKKHTSHKKHSRKVGVTYMAKRRRGHRRSSRKGGFGGSIWGKIVGVGGYIAFEAIAEPFIANWIPNEYMDIAELGLGIWLSNKGGIVGDIAKAAVYINTYTLMKRYFAPAVNNAVSLFQF